MSTETQRKQWNEATKRYASTEKGAQRRAAYQRKYGKTEKGKLIRLRRSLKPYGLTIEQFNEMSEKQGHVCYLCGKANKTKQTTRLVVEHDHETGKIRGLVCTQCNNLIRRIEREIGLNKLVKYLTETGQVHASGRVIGN